MAAVLLRRLPQGQKQTGVPGGHAPPTGKTGHITAALRRVGACRPFLEYAEKYCATHGITEEQLLEEAAQNAMERLNADNVV